MSGIGSSVHSREVLAGLCRGEVELSESLIYHQNALLNTLSNVEVSCILLSWNTLKTTDEQSTQTMGTSEIKLCTICIPSRSIFTGSSSVQILELPCVLIYAHFPPQKGIQLSCFTNIEKSYCVFLDSYFWPQQSQLQRTSLGLILTAGEFRNSLISGKFQRNVFSSVLLKYFKPGKLHFTQMIDTVVEICIFTGVN